MLPEILSCEVIENPFDDIVPRNLTATHTKPNLEKEQPISKFKRRNKPATNSNLLSFNEDDPLEAQVSSFKRRKITSVQQVTNASENAFDQFTKIQDKIREAKEK